jgi:cbb3-type cytochrome oxidase maturation protein
VDILYVLVPLSVLLMLGILVLFAWALHGGQFDDLEQQGEFILDADEGRSGLDPNQADRTIGNEQSAGQ